MTNDAEVAGGEGPDAKTLEVYDTRAAEYAQTFAMDAPYPALEAFIDALPGGARVLDLGCGIGAAAARMQARGCEVVALDASAGMAAEAARRHGLEVTVGSFDQTPKLGRFDGVWAHFSLLHAPRSDLPRHLGDIARALHPGGQVMVAMKTGVGTARDGLGRRYTYVGEAELQGLLEAAGLTVTGAERGESEGFDGTRAPWVRMTAHG